jgi:nucleoside-diphosphate-sugar epimerase
VYVWGSILTVASLPLILISGSNGFVGSHLFDFFQAHGFEVVRVNRFMAGALVSDFSFESENYDTDLSFQYKSKDIVFINAAMVFTRQHSSSDVLPQVSGNISFPAVVIDHLLSLDVRVRVLNLSSYWKYWFDIPHGPRNFYSATQKALDELLWFFCRSYDLEVIELICGDIFGKGDTRDKLIPLLIRSGLSRKFVEIRDPFAIIEPVVIDDVCRAVLQLIEDSYVPVPGRFDIFSMFDEDRLRVEDVVRDLESLMNFKFSKNDDNVNCLKEVEILRHWRNVGKSIPNFQRSDLRSSFKPVIENYREDSN